VIAGVGCAAQHIMADNLGYFEDMTGAFVGGEGFECMRAARG
jgi:hypothetical protein